MRYFLLPFSVIYLCVTYLRNKLYDWEWFYKKPYVPDVFSIGIGNLSMGGTGKTPHVEYFVRMLAPRYRIMILSRGYKRKTKGIILADPETASAQTLGDEPMQYFRKYHPQVRVVVGEQRSIAIPYVLQRHPDIQWILLDDIFQHRSVKPHINILLTEYYNIFYKDEVVPVGTLREGKYGARRADAVIVTKCPDYLGYKKHYLDNKLSKYTRNGVPIFYSKIAYGAPIALWDSQKILFKKIVLVTGIAHADYLKDALASSYDIYKHLEFSDHHYYQEKDFKYILDTLSSDQDVLEQEVSIITTEKDAVKWYDQCPDSLKSLSVWYVPIEVIFLDENESSIENFVQDKYQEYTDTIRKTMEETSLNESKDEI